MEQNKLYHEPQVAALCGVHCLNTLLQGPYLSEVDLAQIAQEFDALEQAVMKEGGVDSDDYLKYMAEDSGNVAENGMFSSQVLSKALTVWNLRVLPLDNPEVRAAAREPQLEQAFICNLQEHWFTVRKVGDNWWDFNSLFPAPQPLSQFYLSAFLGSLKQQGYTIFVVRGNLPQPQPQEISGPGKWFTPEQAKVANAGAAAARLRGKNTNAVENALSLAAKQGGTLQLRTAKRTAPVDAAEDEDENLAAAIAASLVAEGSHAPSTSGRGAPLSTAPGQGVHHAVAALTSRLHAEGDGGVHAAGDGNSAGFIQEEEEEDPELAAAIAASMADASAMEAARAALPAAASTAKPAAASSALAEVAEEEPEAGPGVVELAFRLPGGQRVMRRFSATAPMASLYRYLRTQHGLAQHTITTQFPRKELVECDTTLAAAGISVRETLNVELRR